MSSSSSRVEPVVRGSSKERGQVSTYAEVDIDEVHFAELYAVNKTNRSGHTLAQNQISKQSGRPDQR